MIVEPALRQDLLAAIPSLRAFAMSLLHNSNQADDLVQDTIVRAWGAMDRFERGTNLNAWLFTILRNLFYSQHRRTKREVEDPDGSYAAKLRTAPDQQSHLDFEDLRTALAKLPLDQREALLLITAEGHVVRRSRRDLWHGSGHDQEQGAPSASRLTLLLHPNRLR
jgi:RNA polymerase sigma-70 factor (ECF subfamily)